MNLRQFLLTHGAVNHPRRSASVLTLGLLVDSPRAVRADPEKKELPVLGFPVRHWIGILGHAGVPCVTVVTGATIGVSYEARTLTTCLDITFVRSL